MKKEKYESPQIEITRLENETHLLAGSEKVTGQIEGITVTDKTNDTKSEDGWE